MKPDSLETALLEYFAHFNARDYEAILDSLYPPLFELVPKRQFRAALQAQFNPEEPEASIRNIRLLRADPEVQVGKTRYRLLHYRFEMYLSSCPQNKFTEGLLKAQYGDNNVSYQEETAAFCIQTNGRMFAIADPAFAGWKLVERKDEFMPLLEQLLPAEVLFGT